MEINIGWSDMKDFLASRKISIQYLVIQNQYHLWAIDGPVEVSAQIPIEDPPNADQLDFETNYQPSANQSPTTMVITQYEKEDKVLRLAKAKGDIDPETRSATVYVKVPGEFGSPDGRWLAGGYGISADYHPDDWITCWVEDKDRVIAMMIAQSIDPAATDPVADEMIQGMGVIPGINREMPHYPIVQSYTDWDQAPEEQGWYFWPLATGGSTPAVGEVEINPIGGYGFAPSGFYVKIVYQRPEGMTTGSIRVNFDWGRKES